MIRTLISAAAATALLSLTPASASADHPFTEKRARAYVRANPPVLDVPIRDTRVGDCPRAARWKRACRFRYTVDADGGTLRCSMPLLVVARGAKHHRLTWLDLGDDSCRRI